MEPITIKGTDVTFTDYDVAAYLWEHDYRETGDLVNAAYDSNWLDHEWLNLMEYVTYCAHTFDWDDFDGLRLPSVPEQALWVVASRGWYWYLAETYGEWEE